MFFWITFTFCSSQVSWQQPEDDFEPENQTDWKTWRVTAGGRRQKRLNCRINDPFNYSWELPGEEESPLTAHDKEPTLCGWDEEQEGCK